MIKATKLLPIAFVFTGLVAIVDRAFNEEMSRLAAIRLEFAEAIGDTRGRLANSAWAVLSDAQIQQNLSLGNSNTVTQSIQGYVRPGEVSQLDLYDVSCSLLARVPQSGKPLPGICDDVSTGKPSLKWILDEQKEPVLVAVAVRQWGSQMVVAVAHLVFDQTWLSLHHQLAKLVGDRDINIDLSGGADLWREGALGNGQYALTLRVDGWLYRMLPELTGLALNPAPENFWIVFGAFGLIMLLALSEASIRLRKDLKERCSFEDWIKEHGSTKVSGGADGPLLSASWLDLLELTKRLLASKEEQRTQQVRLMSERLDSATTRLREREIELVEVKTKLADLTVVSSLRHQLRHTTSALLQQVDKMSEVCDTIYDVAYEGLSRQAKELQEFCKRWNAGLNQGNSREMGARKFFRSLVEMPGKTPGTSQLDDDMKQLESISTATLDQSLHAAMLSKKIIEDCKSMSQMAGIWYSIGHGNGSDKSSDWGDCLLSAQSLIKGDNNYQAVNFESLPQLGNPDEMYPSVSNSALVIGFFHLYLAILEGSDPSLLKLPIVVRQKKSKDQATIILSLPSRKLGRPEDAPSQQMSYHVEIARQILSPCGLKVSILPATAAGYPVGLTWYLPKLALVPSEPIVERREPSVDRQF